MQYPTEIKLELNLFASFKTQKKILLLFNSILNFFWGAVRLGACYNYGSKCPSLKYCQSSLILKDQVSISLSHSTSYCRSIAIHLIWKESVLKNIIYTALHSLQPKLNPVMRVLFL